VVLALTFLFVPIYRVNANFAVKSLHKTIFLSLHSLLTVGNQVSWPTMKNAVRVASVFLIVKSVQSKNKCFTFKLCVIWLGREDDVRQK